MDPAVKRPIDTLRRIVLTTLTCLIPGIIVGGFMGLGLAAVLYVPANLAIPLLVVVALYHLLQARLQFFVNSGLLLLIALVAALFAIGFTVDLKFINTGVAGTDLFRKDYYGWFWPAMAMLLPLPFLHAWLKR